MLPAFGLYTHIQANRQRSWFLLASFLALGLVLVFAIALFMRAASGSGPTSYRPGLAAYAAGAFRDLRWLGPIAIAGSLAWIAIAFRFNQALVDGATGARTVSRQDAERLYNLLENLCISRGLSVPILRVMDEEAPNAFASGLNVGQYSITVTSGLLAILSDPELEAVLAHELTHIQNDDVRTMTIAMIVTGILSFAGEMIIRGNNPIRFSSSSSSSSKDKSGAFLAMLIAVALMAAVWFLSQFVKFALSRSREYLADAGAVELTKNPDAMISALQKIEGKGEIDKVPSGIMELCLDNPRSGFQDMFATHPSIADRIAALQRYAGGAVAIPTEEPFAPEPDEPPALPNPDTPKGGEGAGSQSGQPKTSVPVFGPGLGGPWSRPR